MSKPDPRFFLTAEAMKASVLCEGADVALTGDGEVSHAAALEQAETGALVFVESAKALPDRGGDAGLVLCREKDADAVRATFPNAALGVCAAPKTVFSVLGAKLHQSLLDVLPPLAGIADDARIAPSAQIAPSAVIGPGAMIHDDVRIGPFAMIGPGVVIGSGSVVHAHAAVSHAIIGRECVLSSGVRLGEAGFGYVPDPRGALAVPQLGRVILGDAVHLGANTTVDRGALGDTVIGEGTKIDNLCQIAHNCRIGAHCLIASQTGVSGSVTIGDGVMIGGQAGMADHIDIGAGAIVSARAGLMRNVPPGERWGGVPARPAREWMKETAALSRLAKGGRGKGDGN